MMMAKNMQIQESNTAKLNNENKKRRAISLLVGSAGDYSKLLQTDIVNPLHLNQESVLQGDFGMSDHSKTGMSPKRRQNES